MPNKTKVLRGQVEAGGIGKTTKLLERVCSLIIKCLDPAFLCLHGFEAVTTISDPQIVAHLMLISILLQELSSPSNYYFSSNISFIFFFLREYHLSQFRYNWTGDMRIHSVIPGTPRYTGESNELIRHALETTLNQAEP